ncbi:hypothetical protein AFCDBAGC_4568 [Methylobacterium cerastii]|uniref:DUF6894 domain-containing protein n=1 Tax=Methylobacterium cerastii TaxID=932741 RepID=A0ABQ4QP40_9HYPH|nr:MULTISPECIES: hypothetical protein [Methylobacterium]TXN01224.1 hypothetical protein FV222_10895 [Methylobacterium sp. WL103]TXN17178.1 hypothetical protein FV219_00945 [Methylobacterium sp. WL122]GJD46685.1 hypothetical protein AFCDBAGC_4568 [Methylobacterium cerastii]
MSRYVIDSCDDEHLILGDEGIAFDTLEDARTAALAALPDMARDKLATGDHRTFSTAVRDMDGTVFYRATLTLADEWLNAPNR